MTPLDALEATVGRVERNVRIVCVLVALNTLLWLAVAVKMAMAQ